ncbi:Uncharacterised protein [Bordetella pertussis]|nr:Uncharacterised protein [Bordetella pertussis]
MRSAKRRAASWRAAGSASAARRRMNSASEPWSSAGMRRYWKSSAGLLRTALRNTGTPSSTTGSM